MLPNGRSELLERLDPRAESEVGPFAKKAIGVGDVLVFPESLEVLLEEVSTYGAEIDRDQVPEAQALLPCQVGSRSTHGTN